MNEELLRRLINRYSNAVRDTDGYLRVLKPEQIDSLIMAILAELEEDD